MAPETGYYRVFDRARVFVSGAHAGEVGSNSPGAGRDCAFNTARAGDRKAVRLEHGAGSYRGGVGRGRQHHGALKVPGGTGRTPLAAGTGNDWDHPGGGPGGRGADRTAAVADGTQRRQSAGDNAGRGQGVVDSGSSDSNRGEAGSRAGLGLTQIGEFSYVLLRVARDAQLVGDDVYNATLAASVVTNVLNGPLLLKAGPRARTA